MSLWKVGSIGLSAVVLLMLGAAAGGWATAHRYQTQLEAAQSELSTTIAARNNLQALAQEQGLALGRLIQAGKDRQRLAELALQRARDEARSDHDAANRLQQERIGGDPALAAVTIIDQELGL